ncbi:MAG: threonylcarbamoyl-AMP synthase, partial [Thermoanaerobacterales bacterium]|nr:threonylcarbamoyl-AMP synthase [Thermoanaerobacterales bacterium]
MKKTQIIKVDKERPSHDEIAFAAKIIRRGGLVVFPTETVYGLGANALDESAAMKIYEAKGRPQDNPLIVHVQSKSELGQIVQDVPKKAHILIERFWPGPLSIIFKRHKGVPSGTTGGLDTVAVRMPNHPVALMLIKESGVPIAAPSANISGRPSPVCADDVIEDLSGRVDLIFDVGKTLLGVESTVLDLTEGVPVILRPGGITREQLEEVLGPVELDFGAEPGQQPRSPVQKYRHYAPKAQVTVIEGPIEFQVETIKKIALLKKEQGYNVGIMATSQTRNKYNKGKVLSVGDRTAPLTISSNLFSILRKFDRMGVDVILSESIEKEGLGLAVMNRLYKA